MRKNEIFMEKEIKEMKKNYILTGLLIACMAMSGVLCFCSYASAAGNTSDSTFSYNNDSSVGYTSYRDKLDKTKVYIYPMSGPKVYYTVGGKKYSTGTTYKCSSKVAIQTGTKASVTNSVAESGCDAARIKFERIKSSYLDTYGKWSPDSKTTYQVFY